MQMVPVPLYDSEMAVQAYLFRYQMGNGLFSVAQTTGVFDDASRSAALETVNTVGLDAISLGKPLFLPVNYIMLLGDLAAQCGPSPGEIIFLLEEPPPPEEPYLSKMAALREKGFRFAVSNLSQPQNYNQVIELSDYFCLSQRDEKRIASAGRIVALLRKHYPALQWVATDVRDETLQKHLGQVGYSLYESRFNRIPVTRGAAQVSPLKANSIRLINTVQDENFEFDEVAGIVQADPSLSVSLLRLVNTPLYRRRSRVQSIAQAVAMLGQKEVRKWVTTAVSQTLGEDRPGEITRISLLRAKFAENLAPLFDMAHIAQELFLMGLFSVLDIMLEVPMEEALRMIPVSDMIQKSLLEQSGLLYPILCLLEDYEAANWSPVSRQMIVNDIGEEELYTAYVEALIWYRNVTAETDGEELDGEENKEKEKEKS